MGISHIEVAELETDDVIASYALTYGKAMKIVISSFDSDFFQLINGNVSVLRYRGDKTIICDSDYIRQKYNITPQQYADFKSLTGDNSDNIKGADKVGPKTAAQLLNQFGTLNEILSRADEIVKISIRESIQKNIERIRKNNQIIKLDDKAILPFELGKLEYSYTGITTNEILQEIGLR